MSRSVFHDVARDGNGVIVSGAVITVYLAGTSTLATIYASSTGAAASGSQVTSGSNGEFTFWVDDGDYGVTQTFKLSIAGPSNLNLQVTTIDYVPVFQNVIPKKKYTVHVGGTIATGTLFTGDTLGQASTVIGMFVYVKDAPAGSSLTVDLLKNGVAQSVTVTVADGGNSGSSVFSKSFTATDLVGFTAPTVGSQFAGAEMTITLVYT